MEANDSKSYLIYLNKLLDKYNNTYHSSIGSKSINADYSKNWKLRPILKVLSLKSMIQSELLSIRIVSVKDALKIGHEKYLLSILFWKLILGFIKIKSLNREKTIGRFYE